MNENIKNNVAILPSALRLLDRIPEGGLFIAWAVLLTFAIFAKDSPALALVVYSVWCVKLGRGSVRPAP